MRNTKKAISILLTLLMVVGMMSTFAFAADSYSITINDGRTDRTYEAYQIFKGTVAKDGENSLGNVTWGDNIKLAADGSFTFNEVKYTNAKELSQVLDTSNIRAFAAAVETKGPAKKTVSEKTGEGYVLSGLEPGYYLVKEVTTSGTGDANSDFIIKVASNVTANPKSVEDNNIPSISKTPLTQSVSVGENAEFKLTATLPANLADYPSYKLTFKDTMSNGLTYNGNAEVYITDAEGNKIKKIDVTPTVNGQDIEIAIADVKALTYTKGTETAKISSDNKIIVEYTAKVNAVSVEEQKTTKSTNQVYLVYSKDPKDPIKTSETRKMTVTVTNRTVEFTKRAGDKEITLDGGTKIKAPLTGAGFEIYKYDATAENHRGELIRQLGVVKPEAATPSGEKNVGSVSADGTVFTFTGLGAGKYILVESVTPDGYNTLADQEFTITDNEELTGLGVDVVNEKGSLLPTTGGIGTTIFYLIGAILVIGAGVVFVTRRRMHSDK